MSTRAVALALLVLPGTASADDRVPVKQSASLVDAALTKHVTALTEQRRRRRGTVRSIGTRRSLRRIITGASVAIGGALVARTAHTRIGEIDARNRIRDEWNTHVARVEEVSAEYDRECRSFSTAFTDHCLELRFEVVPMLALNMTTLAEDFPFLPQAPNVGLYVTSEEEEQIQAWFTTPSTLESSGRWNTTRYGSLAAVGIGALLATIWSDVPVVRNLRVHRTPTSTAMTTRVEW